MFKKPIVEDPNVLGALVVGHGGTIVNDPGGTFTFDLPRSAVEKVVPEFNRLNVHVRKIGEATIENPRQLFSSQSVVRLQLCRQREAKGEDTLREGRLRFMFDR
jgi:hypothetical protein